MTICGLARAREPDINRCYEAVSKARNHRIHTFLATSDIHLKYKLQVRRSNGRRWLPCVHARVRTLLDLLLLSFAPPSAAFLPGPPQISREECLKQIDAMVRHAKYVSRAAAPHTRHTSESAVRAAANQPCLDRRAVPNATDRCATTLNSRPRTPGAPTLASWSRPWASPSRLAPPRSTFPVRHATPRPACVTPPRLMYGCELTLPGPGPDTVGYNLPHQYGDRMKFLIENTKGALPYNLHPTAQPGAVAHVSTPPAVQAAARPSGPRTATTTLVWQPPIRWPASTAARARRK